MARSSRTSQASQARAARQIKRLYEMCAMAIVAGRADLDGAAEVGFDIELPVFSVGAAGELANVHPQTLRQYDRLGLVVPQRTEGGARRYSLRDISRLAQAQQLSQEEGVNLAGITRILELEEENRELRRQVERLRKPAGSSVFAADADGGIVEVERSQRARMWRRQLRADARQLPSRESVRAERAEEGDDIGEFADSPFADFPEKRWKTLKKSKKTAKSGIYRGGMPDFWYATTHNAASVSQ